MEYRSAIVDELGCFVVWLSEADEGLLESHPEWRIELIQIS